MSDVQRRVLLTGLAFLVSTHWASPAAEIGSRQGGPTRGIPGSGQTNEADLVQIVQRGTNVEKQVFLDAVKMLSGLRSTNAIRALVQMIDYRCAAREPRAILGPPERFDEAWPVASALVRMGTPSLDALAEIIERDEDPRKVAIAETAMVRILGYKKRNAYLRERVERATDRRVIERLQRYIVPERPLH